MGKSSPTKMQLKHIPDIVVLQTVFALQNMWYVKITSVLKEDGPALYLMPENRLTFDLKRTVRSHEIAEALVPIPKKLIRAKLKKLELQGRIGSYGPSGDHYRVELDD